MFLVAASAPGPATATTTSGTFVVSVTIPKSCTLATSTFAFGAYTGVVINATTTLTVTCTSTTTYQIGANLGLYSAYVGAYAKYMNGPSSNRLRYHIYTDATRSVEWGTTPGTDEVTGTGTGAAQTITVYGTIGAGNYGIPGAYSDTVTFEITF